MFIKLTFSFVLMISMMSCKKDTIEESVETVPLTPPQYKIKFMFVNRIGFRNDSIGNGMDDTLFQGPCLDCKYYDKAANVTNFSNTCYNRNFPANNFPTSDSVLFRSFNSSNGSRFAFQIEMRWWKYTGPPPYNKSAIRILTYTTKGWNYGDTIKDAKDTIIKFIWPDDTASGKYIKTYQWP